MGLRRAKLNDDGVFKYFALMDHVDDINTNQIVDEYLVLRHQVFSPEAALFMRPSSTRYGYENRVIGKNQFSKMTCLVAKLLGKPNPEAYTFPTIRHSIATLMADRGASAEELRVVGGWKGIKAPLEYVRRSVEARKENTEESNLSLNNCIRTASRNAGPFDSVISNGNKVHVTVVNCVMKGDLNSLLERV